MKINCFKLAAILFVFLFLLCGQGQAKDGTAVSMDGVEIQYSVYGKGEPALVLVHGWSCNRSVWDKQVPFFKEKYRVITLDLAGHGSSGKQRKDYTMNTFGEDVAAVVKAVKASKVILIGHSMGGPVIIEAAQLMPDKVIAVVGIDTMQNFEGQYSPEQVEEIVKPFKENFKKAANSFVRSMFVKGTPEQFIDGIVTMMSNADPQVAISAMMDMFSMSYVKNPPKLIVPVWALNADLWPTAAEVNRKFVPEFNLRIIPGVGHFLMMEKPDEFNKELDGMINEIVKRSL